MRMYVALCGPAGFFFILGWLHLFRSDLVIRWHEKQAVGMWKPLRLLLFWDDKSPKLRSWTVYFTGAFYWTVGLALLAFLGYRRSGPDPDKIMPFVSRMVGR